ncbi:MAG TPA: RodZ domain-containing protein [Anaerolineales bacterium]|nr:RodZ domain-containing protein [Anaerolineales bacterium]
MTQTIGQRLKAEREEQRLTLEKVFEATRIRVQYLQALEEDDLSVMPSPVQARGYLRNYAEYLGFDVDRMLHDLREQNAQPSTGEVIGPADISSPPPPETKALEIEPIVQEPQPFDVVSAQPVEELTIAVKPKPARRKKNGSEPTLATAEPLTRRRGRRKTETEVVPVAEAEPVPPEETGTAMNLAPQPEQIEEPVTGIESTAPVETIAGEVLDESQEVPAPVDVSDSLWQTWLNRVGSILSARARRRTLTRKESPPPEIEPIAERPDLPVVAQNEGLESYQQILKEIGRELRQRRELLSLHFDEVERNTHVKAHYLDALERGALNELPSTVQTRGMLSNYATFLDLDVDALLLRFADALQARHRERNPQKPARKPGQPILTNIPPVRSFIAGDMIFGIGMAVLLVGFAIWGVNRVMTIQSQREVPPTAISISDVLLTAPDPSLATATATFIQVESLPGEATVTVEIPTQNVNADVQLNLVAVERTYLRVVVDGEVAFDGRVVPGNAYPFEAENQIEVLVGSGAAIRIVYNGRDLGLMGTFGQVVNNIYLGTEIITPTSMPTTTPTITPTPTRTAPPTATSRFTDTPVPSATAVP